VPDDFSDSLIAAFNLPQST